MQKFVVLLCVLSFIQGCMNVKTEGMKISKTQVESVIIGKTKADDLDEIFGSPSFRIENTNYYVGFKKGQRMFFDPVVLESSVVGVTLNDYGVVSSVNSYKAAKKPQYRIKNHNKPQKVNISTLLRV